jgi:hypothetical protein
VGATILKPAVEALRLLGIEPVGDAPSEREDLHDADGERRGRRQPAKLGLQVLAEVRRKRVEQRDVRPDRRAAPRKELSPLGLEPLLCGTVELQRDHQRSLVFWLVTHLLPLPAPPWGMHVPPIGTGVRRTSGLKLGVSGH